MIPYTSDSIKKAINDASFTINHSEIKAAKQPTFEVYDDLGLSEAALKFWKEKGYDKMYSHQKEAIRLAKEGHNICVSTSTSSGKTEIFQTIAIESLSKRKGAKVLAVYSTKALNKQQRERWEKTGLKIGQIDGDNSNFEDRKKVLKESDIVVMTPDVIQAFLLANVNTRNLSNAIQSFIKNVDLIIIDEIHLYRGIFGTNSAYLFRRFNNLRRHYKKDFSFPQYVTASATLPNPSEHSKIITGAKEFENIGIDKDGSPTAATEFLYIEKTDRDTTFTKAISDLIVNLATIENARSITFTNGRQQAGVYVIDGRNSLDDLKLNEEYKIYAFRAGGEPAAREKILNALEKKEFNGIVSTSALEIGIDVQGLNICILANVPFDLNSYYQRIGRVGRGGMQERSYVIIINDESVPAKILFDNNFDIDTILPDLEPALHLDNKQIIDKHFAMHIDGENPEFPTPQNMDINDFVKELKEYFPKSFCDLARKYLTEQETNDVVVCDDLHTQSIRNMGDNYSIYEGKNQDRPIDNITRKQMHTEAYPNAVRNAFRLNNGEVEYYRQRVTGIDKNKKEITVKTERPIHTKPNKRKYIKPHLTKKGINGIFKFGDTLILNSLVTETTTIYGYYENRSYKPYNKIFRDSHRSDGIIIFNKILNGERVRIDQIAQILYHALLMRKHFERSDIDNGSGRLIYSSPIKALGIKMQDRFITIYDNSSFNISSELMKPEIFKSTFSFLKNNLNHFAETLFGEGINDETKDAIKDLCADICDKEVEEIHLEELPETIQVFAPESVAIYKTVNSETGEYEEIQCKIALPQKVANQEYCVDYAIQLENQIKYNVGMEELSPLPESVFCEFDWKNGVIVP